jgi:hypothetical protein
MQAGMPGSPTDGSILSCWSHLEFLVQMARICLALLSERDGVDSGAGVEVR